MDAWKNPSGASRTLEGPAFGFRSLVVSLAADSRDLYLGHREFHLRPLLVQERSTRLTSPGDPLAGERERFSIPSDAGRSATHSVMHRKPDGHLGRQRRKRMDVIRFPLGSRTDCFSVRASAST